MGLLGELRAEADDIRGSGVVQRGRTAAASRQLGKAEGMRKVCNAVEKRLHEILIAYVDSRDITVVIAFLQEMIR